MSGVDDNSGTALDVEYLLDSVADLQRKHVELEIMLRRIDTELDQRNEDIGKVVKKRHDIQEENNMIDGERARLCASSSVIRSNICTTRAKIAQLTKSIQAIDDQIQSIKVLHTLDRNRAFEMLAKISNKYGLRYQQIDELQQDKLSNTMDY